MASTERFGYEWSKFNEIYDEHEEHFLKWIQPLKKGDFKGKAVLDAGCGNGRNSYFVLRYGARRIVAFDYDHRTVDAAKRNLAGFKNAEVKYISIYDIKYKNEFDIALCIGVIHHLKYPSKAILNLAQSVKRGGLVLVWVYGFEGNQWIVKYISPIRRITSRLPLGMVNMASYLLSVPLFIYLRLPQSHPYLKQISKFKFKHLHAIVLDQLIPEIANYWRKEEALKLFEGKGLKNIRIYNVNNNSWTVLGIKK